MIHLDRAALETRFKEGFDLSSKQVLTMNKPVASQDRQQPWCSFAVVPGERVAQERGQDTLWLQLGGVVLNIWIPKNLGIKAGDALAVAFDDLFREWTSPDGSVVVSGLSQSVDDKGDLYLVRLRARYQSRRLAQQG